MEDKGLDKEHKGPAPRHRENVAQFHTLLELGIDNYCSNKCLPPHE